MTPPRMDDFRHGAGAWVLALAWVWTAFLRYGDLEPPHQASTVRMLKAQEGFKGNPYPDAGGQSVGYGTRFPLTAAEGELLLLHRLGRTEQELVARWVPYKDQPEHIKQALSLMAYQLGVEGELHVQENVGLPWSAAIRAAPHGRRSTRNGSIRRRVGRIRWPRY